MTDALDVDINQVDTDSRKVRITAAGGILAALAASTCCINLTSLETYKPIFIVITLGFLGYGYLIVYCRPNAYAVGDTYARPLPSRRTNCSSLLYRKGISDRNLAFRNG